MPTAGLVDGKEIELKGVYVVRGTETYKTTTGSNTVFVLTLENEAEKRRRQADEAAKIAADAAARAALAKVQSELQKKREQAEAEQQKAKAEEEAAAKKKEAERGAAVRLEGARVLLTNGKTEKAIERLKSLIADYPETKASNEARAILKELFGR